MIRRAIIQTIAYADVFDYPLTSEELWKFIISKNAVSKDSLEKALSSISSIISQDGLYCFKDRRKIIQIRKQRKKESKKKFTIAQKTALSLSAIPTIQFLGISGALAMGNAQKNDDIDFFIITQKNTLWLTRLLYTIYLEVKGIRRKRNEKNVANKICLNMLIDESYLTLPNDKQNLYTAHEIVQIKPLFNRGNTFQKFMIANRWVGKFLPNGINSRTKPNYTQNYAESIFSVFLRFVQRISALELLAKKLQLWYMKRDRTKETVSKYLLAFHPKDYQAIILREYKKREEKYGKV